jgi:16S rRNA (cytidine1402-2'-O)-methyltransferase
MPGRLILCATPIGNLEDASARLRAALETADTVYAEDTRRSQILLRHLGIERALRSYFAGNEAERSREIAAALGEGATVALVTDAGMPAIADPGHSAVRAALAVGAEVTVIPGPSAVTAALAVSGLPSERFVFEGFLPRKGSARVERLRAIAAERRTIVVFAAPSRMVRDLEDFQSVLGPDRPIAVVRELTKLHEEIWRGSLADAVQRWSDEVRPRGEFTLVLGGAAAPDPPPLTELVGSVESQISAGVSTSDAVREVASEYGVSRRELYELVVRDPGDA